MSFQEHYVEADGFRIRYLEAGQGEPLVFFHGGGGVHLSKMHDMLAAKRRIIAFEVPGFGDSPVNTRTQSMAELATTMGAAVAALGIDKFAVMGISFGGKLALWTTILHPEKITAAVLIAPAAIRPENAVPPSSPAEMRAIMYAHPERIPAGPPPNPEAMKKNMGFAMRIIGPGRDTEMEARMADTKVPVLVLMGTADRLIPPAMGRHYREKLPDCHVVMVYDAAHAVDTDRPEACFAVVDDFLMRQGKFVVSNENGVIFP
ncbi:MAG TPA: alpha/beta fold hydrolase [Stellaceae bacterium]